MLKEQLLMGNEAIGLGALRAGVGFVAGYLRQWQSTK